jgi:hypothetical protein
LEHFRGQPAYYHAAQREASGRPNCAAAKIFSGFTEFAEQKENQLSSRIFETNHTTNKEKNMNAP